MPFNHIAVTQSTNDNRARRPVGRPRDMAKRARILAAAVVEVHQHGDEARMDDIAARAKVSKVTIYNHYESKARLIELATDELIRRMARA